MITQSKNPIDLDLNRKIPPVIDLHQRDRCDIDLLNRENERIFTPQMEPNNRLDFRHALDYLAGLDQLAWQRDAAMNYIEKLRGTPDFTIFCNALFRMQSGIVQRRKKKEAMEQRLRGPVVEDVAKSKREDFISRSPNLTKSYVRNPNRLKVVKG
ncbi:hypothetical protein [Acidithiobacillus thiooxidans]|uniref:hypothetical protein n=1 Tax=Acidithiobacillus thiooxidans TaxID=930 RepID=UPI001C071255|nr:hypothetical protein [Acidithiobacillus thiooxidans]MBU2843542.1 hypothetical protein [Acidithiobacillus thiooxidans]